MLNRYRTKRDFSGFYWHTVKMPRDKSNYASVSQKSRHHPYIKPYSRKGKAQVEGESSKGRNEWKDATRKKLEYYSANVNSECWVLYKARRPIDHIQPYIISRILHGKHQS